MARAAGPSARGPIDRQAVHQSATSLIVRACGAACREATGAGFMAVQIDAGRSAPATQVADGSVPDAAGGSRAVDRCGAPASVPGKWRGPAVGPIGRSVRHVAVVGGSGTLEHLR